MSAPRMIDLGGSPESVRYDALKPFIEQGYTTCVADLDIVRAGLPEAFTAIIVRLPWEEREEATAEMEMESRCIGVIIEIDAHAVGPEDIDTFVFHRIYAQKLSIRVEVQYGETVPSPEEFDRWLAAFEEAPIARLIFMSDGEPLERGMEDAYITPILNHKQLVERTRMEAHFLTSFRPTHCTYLDPSRPVIVIRDGAFVVCPHHRAVARVNGDPLPGFEKVGTITQEIQRIRLDRYAWADRPFTCTRCIAEGRGL